ncbi:MAG: endonuclease III [archaeon]|nr:endonuclease III [archaeon]
MEKLKYISEILEILKEFQKGIRKTTLNRESRDSKRYSPYQTLISCLLSLRAKDEVTEVISEDLFKVAKTPEEMLKISEKKLKQIIFSSGHFNKKAEAIRHVSRELIERFNSKVPETSEELMSIKHIGPKTANIVLAFCFGKEVIPVDVHVNRIPNRIGWIKTKTPEQSEIALMEIIPKEYWSDFNGIFVLFGKTICLPVSPKCSECPIEKYCKKIGVGRSR